MDLPADSDSVFFPSAAAIATFALNCVRSTRRFLAMTDPLSRPSHRHRPVRIVEDAGNSVAVFLADRLADGKRRFRIPRLRRFA